MLTIDKFKMQLNWSELEWENSLTTTKNKIKIINSYAVKCNEEKLKLTILFNNELLLYNIAII